MARAIVVYCDGTINDAISIRGDIFFKKMKKFFLKIL